MAIVDCYLSF